MQYANFGISSHDASSFSYLANNIADRFYGFTENSREVEIDNREMVDKVKRGEPLYGASKLSSYLQGVAARNSRYSEMFIHVIPWVNAVNHDQVSRLEPYLWFVHDIWEYRTNQ